MLMQAVAAARTGKPMPDFTHLPYFAHLSREQMARLNKEYEDARNTHAARRRAR